VAGLGQFEWPILASKDSGPIGASQLEKWVNMSKKNRPQPKCLLLICVCLASSAVGFAEPPKPRVVVLTDVSTWETDDSESLVRLLVHADMLEIEGLVFTTGWSLGTTRYEFLELIQVAINAYEQDLPNLRKRSGQDGHVKDESRQTIGYWPSPQSLRDRTMFGSRRRGAEHIGEGNDSPGSRADHRSG
jgi:hypothetical protein